MLHHWYWQFSLKSFYCKYDSQNWADKNNAVTSTKHVSRTFILCINAVFLHEEMLVVTTGEKGDGTPEI